MNTTPALALLAALAALGCEAPTVDPDPVGGSPASGALEGTVLYGGPRPSCDYDGETPTRVRGNIVLLMFFSNNPPAPGGSATSAENLLLIPGGEVFSLDDCLPAAPTPDDLRVPLTRSVAFTWPDVALAAGPTPEGEEPPDVPIHRRGDSVDYQIRGFFDADEDFNPLFSVRRLATRGDVAGGAFVNAAAPVPQFARVRFSNPVAQPNGQVVGGVAVTLGAIVNTELPASFLASSTTALSAEAPVPALPDALAREEALWQLTQAELSLVDPAEESWAFTLRAAGVHINAHPSGYGFFAFPVDGNRDGMQDAHPTLGAAGIQWEHPIVILRRARNPFELAVGVPDVVILGSVRPSQTLAKDTFSRNIDIAIPPIAVMNLDPENPLCQVAVLAPGNLAETYERIPVDCQEIPTGNYDVNVLSGLAGGVASNYRAQISGDMPELPPSVLETIVRTRTDNDWVIEGGQFSSQAWSVPNELGCPDPYRPNALDDNGAPITVSQLDQNPLTNCGDPAAGCDSSGTLMQCSQGPAGRFSVVDPDLTNAPTTPDHSDGHGVASCQTAFRASTLMPDAVTYMPVPSECCAGIQHLCDLPLCATRDAAARAGAAPEGSTGARAIREVTAADLGMTEEGARFPTCVPFLMPASCCGG